MNGDQRLDVRLVGDHGAELQLAGAAGLEAVPTRARLLSEGPVEAVIRLEAQPAGNAAARLLVWLHAYRNRPWLRAVVRTCGIPGDDFVRLRIPVETLGDPLRASLGMSLGSSAIDWLPGETFPLDARSVTRMFRKDTAAVWSAQLDGQTFWTDESHAWAEVGALGWGVSVGALPGSADHVRAISLSGTGNITVDIAPAGGGCATVELFFQFRAGRGGDVREFQAFSNPLVASAEASWYQDSLGLGPHWAQQRRRRCCECGDGGRPRLGPDLRATRQLARQPGHRGDLATGGLATRRQRHRPWASPTNCGGRCCTSG